MLDKEQIVEWLYENCRDEHGNLILRELDLRRFNDVYFNKNIVHGTLYQNFQNVEKCLYQSYQKVGGNLEQNNSSVSGCLYQSCQRVSEDLAQHSHCVAKNLIQHNQTVGGDLVSHKLQDNEYWVNKKSCITRKTLKDITAKELAEMGYRLKGE